MLDYPMGIFRAMRPKTRKEAIALALFAPLMTYACYSAVMKEVPQTQVFTDTAYPKEVIRGSVFFLVFDLAFNRSCRIESRRIVTGSDGVEYLSKEESKEVKAGERMQYIVRVPIGPEIPYGPARIRSDFEYGCDFWSRYVSSIKSRGRDRFFNIIPGNLGQYNYPDRIQYVLVKAEYP